MMPELASHYWAEAPGSCMLFGEHAVLRGYPAIVCALKPRLRVNVCKRLDGQFVIHAMGKSKTVSWNDRKSLTNDFCFLEACISSFKEKVACGLEITVESALESTKGFGSSAAVIASALLAIALAIGEIEKPCRESNFASDRLRDALLDKGLLILREVQGFGSGADLAASIYGGCLEYSYSRRPKPLAEPDDFYLIYSGHKTPTSQVLKWLYEKQLRGDLDLSAIDELGQVSVAALAFWSSMKAEDCDIRQHLCERHQEAMRRLQLFDEGLEKVCEILRAQGAQHKISGSGLGDCVLSFDKPAIIDSSVTKVTPELVGLTYGYLA